MKKFYKFQWVRFKCGNYIDEGYIIRVHTNGMLTVSQNPNDNNTVWYIHKDNVIDFELIV